MVTSRPEIVGTFGVVATTHWLATATGMAILEKGGNAFDAAVAAGCVLHIVEPDQNGPGRRLPDHPVERGRNEGRSDLRPGRGAGGDRATKLKDMGLDVMPGIGHLPTVVPGSFGAWMRLLADYGTMGVRDVLAAGHHIAADGYPMKPGVADADRRRRGLHDANTGRVRRRSILPGGNAPEADGCSRTRHGRDLRAYRHAKPKRPAATARTRSRRRGAPGTKASSPRRSTVSCANR